jgi:cytochrome c556
MALPAARCGSAGTIAAIQLARTQPVAGSRRLLPRQQFHPINDVQGTMSERHKQVSARWGRSAAVLLAAALAVTAQADAPAAPPTPAKQAIDARKAVFTLIGSNFRPVGEVLQGKTAYDAEDARKRATRLQFLAGLLDDAFPDISSSGDTRARPEIWSNRAEFDQKLKEFQAHSATLLQVASRDKSSADDFKAAAGAVGQDCKGCHESYRTK